MHYDSEPSVWRISELLTWTDFGFLQVSDRSDIENYCSFMGAYDICSMFRGVLPIVHGPLGCVNSYFATRISTRLSEKVKPLPFSTCMDSSDVVFGAIPKLEKQIKQVDELYHPKLIVILTTCVSDMITENVDMLVNKLKDEVRADILPIVVGGITCKGFREGADFAFKALMDYVKTKNASQKTNAKSVNLFLRRVNGKLSENEDVHEMERLLGINGIKINTIVRIGTTYEELLKIPQAEANVSLCFTYGKEVMKHLKETFNQEYSNSSYPLGLSGTLRWVKKLTDLVCAEDKLSSSFEAKQATAEVNRLKALLAKSLAVKECYIWHPGEKALAFTGLARDLGLDPILVGYTYWMIKTTRETIISMLQDGNDPKAIIRGHSKLWLDYENQLEFNKRPLLLMPKKFWLGNLPCVDIDLFRDHAIGLTGLKNILARVEDIYSHDVRENHSIFDRYVERRYEMIEWSAKIDDITRVSD